MGYTHHWKHPTGFALHQWTELRLDFVQLADAYRGILLAEDGTRSGFLRAWDYLYFQGGAEGVEHFKLTRHPMFRFGFCKTERAPYDVMVCAALAVAADHDPAFIVESDGTADDWRPHIKWASEVLGRTLMDPVRRPPA